MRYQSYVDGRNYTSGEHWNKTNLAYQKTQDELAQKNWEKEFKENKRQFNEQLKLSKKAKASGGSGGGGYRRSGSSYVSVPNGVKQTIRKWIGGNEGQKKVAWNSLNGTLKQKYGLTSAQIDYLYNDYLGFGKQNNKKATAVEAKASDGARKSDASKKKYQSIDDVPEKYRDGILGYADFVRNMPSSPSLSKYGSYPDYLEAMVKKNKKKAKK
jgi:hypothetical protein